MTVMTAQGQTSRLVLCGCVCSLTEIEQVVFATCDRLPNDVVKSHMQFPPKVVPLFSGHTACYCFLSGHHNTHFSTISEVINY